jgi:hypothetical protein
MGLAEHYSLKKSARENCIALINEKLNLYPDDSYFYVTAFKGICKTGQRTCF